MASKKKKRTIPGGKIKFRPLPEGGYRITGLHHGTYRRLPRTKKEYEKTLKGSGVHFGTKRSARQRLAATEASMGKIRKPGRGGRIFIGEATVGKMLGSPKNPLTETEMKFIEAGGSKKVFDEELAGQFEDYPRKHYPSAKQLKKAGYDAIVYRNLVEDPGKVSVSLLDPKKFKPKAVHLLGETTRKIRRVAKRAKKAGPLGVAAILGTYQKAKNE